LDLNNKDIWLVVSNMALIFHDIPWYMG
jgi:hypothetical protein